MNVKEDSTVQKEQSTCAYFVPRKRRLCKMLVSKGKRFCGQHLVNDDQKDDVLNKRIPCPLDPKHSCFENRLVQHLKCCNAREKSHLPFWSKGLNEGDQEPSIQQVQFKDLTDQQLRSIIHKIQKVHKEHIGPIEERIGEHCSLKEAISTPGYGPSVTRHLKQNSSLLAYLEDENLLNSDTERVFIEFGAGRGKLTGWVIEAVKDKEKASFLLIDKGAQRYKVDAKLRYSETLKIKRMRIDIQDLNLSKVDAIPKDSILVACGKHLCGAATDFSLRCLKNCEKGTIGGVAIALCCHHRCSWKSYTGKEFFKTIDLCAKDFWILGSLSSWAVSGSRHANEGQSGQEQTPEEEHEKKESRGKAEEPAHENN